MKDFIRIFSATAKDQKEFVGLTEKMIDVMVDFGLLTLRSINRKKQAPLDSNQIEEIINFDLQFRLQQINDPELLDIVRERVISEFGKENNETKGYSNISIKDDQLQNLF